MYPLSLAERNIETPTVSLKKLLSSEVHFSEKIEGNTDISFKHYLHEIVTSGLPAVRRMATTQRKNMIESYFSNLLTHDFQMQGMRLRQPHTLMRWLRAYSAAISTNAGYNKILDASTAGEGEKPAAKTTIAYREALGNLWLLEELPAWFEGEHFFSGLKMTPKHYLIDPAFATYLLGLDEDILANGGETASYYAEFDRKYGSILGRLFEALVFLSLKVYSSVTDAELTYLATAKNDHEVDFIVSKGRKSVAFEVKLAPYIDESDVKHLLWLKEKAGDRICDAVVVTTGPYAYRREDGIAVVPAALLGA
jgi:predicted AAA+ superfamily ATPase